MFQFLFLRPAFLVPRALRAHAHCIMSETAIRCPFLREATNAANANFASDYGAMNDTLDRLCNDKRETAVKDGRKQNRYTLSSAFSLMERLD